MRYVLALLCFIVIFSGCNVQDYIPALNKENITLENKTIDPACIQDAQKYIPKNITLKVNGEEWEIWEFSWKDGSDPRFYKDIDVIRFKPGTEAGQNVNYLYQYEIHPLGNENYIGYSEKVLDSEGFIVGQKDFGVKFILAAINGTEEKVKSKYFKVDTQVFSVISYEFTYCYNVVFETKQQKEEIITIPGKSFSVEQAYNDITMGMSEKEIIDTYGEPDAVDTNTGSRGYWYYYKGTDKTLGVYINDNKVSYTTTFVEGE